MRADRLGIVESQVAICTKSENMLKAVKHTKLSQVAVFLLAYAICSQLLHACVRVVSANIFAVCIIVKMHNLYCPCNFESHCGADLPSASR